MKKLLKIATKAEKKSAKKATKKSKNSNIKASPRRRRTSKAQVRLSATPMPL
jgi:hypothetical protein